MKAIITDTNCFIGGVPVPVGTFELPFQGDLMVLYSGGGSTNLTVGPSDTLFVWGGGAAVSEGVPVWEFFCLGFGVSLALLFGVGFARRVKTGLVGGRSEV